MDNNFYKITGKLKVIGETVKVSDRFTKRDLVLTTELDSMYPQHVSFQVTQDKCTLLDNFSVGDDVLVSFNIRGREWTSPQGELKHFNTLDAFRIETTSSTSKGIPQGGASEMNLKPTTPPPAPEMIEDGDDLPF